MEQLVNVLLAKAYMYMTPSVGPGLQTKAEVDLHQTVHRLNNNFVPFKFLHKSIIKLPLTTFLHLTFVTECRVLENPCCTLALVSEFKPFQP